MTESEIQVLGAILSDPMQIEKAQSILSKDDFQTANGQLIFEAVKKLGSEADVFTVSELTKIDLDILSDFSMQCLNPDNCKAYSKALKQESTNIKLINLANSISEAVKQGCEPVSVITDTSARLSELSRLGGRKTQFMLGEAIKHLLNDMDERSEGRGMVYDTGITELNEKMPFEAGKLYLLGGQSGMGKTTVVQKFIETQAKAGIPTFFASLEMQSTELAKRMIQSAGSVAGRLFKRPDKYLEKHHSELAAGVSAIKDYSVLIDEDGNVGVQDVILRSRAWLNQQEKYQSEQRGVLVVDYVQLMNYDRGREVQELALITKALKGFAKEMNIPVIALVQLNRDYLKRPVSERRPIVKDIKGSGGMEADSDGIILCHREEYYDEDTPDKGILELIIGKSRDGETGTIRTHAEMHYFRIKDPSYEYNYQG
jgi:replicative DNA helicase